MKGILAFLIATVSLVGFEFNETFEKYFSKIEVSDKEIGVEGIDCIYVINLDRRPDKWKLMEEELDKHGLVGNRVSAVDGLGIDRTDIPSLVTRNRKDKIRRNVIGCFLSHISVWLDAYRRGYKTIWVMEDDLRLLRPPSYFSQMIERLDEIDPEWEVLHGDNYYFDEKYTIRASKYAFFAGEKWHPPSYYKSKRQVDSDLMRVPLRFGCYSMIMSRKGIERLLNYIAKVHIHCPVDWQMNLLDDYRQYSPIESVVEVDFSLGSDTKVVN